jgi:hypothetical protein
VLLTTIYIVLLHDGILCRHLSGSFDLWCHSILEFLYWFFCLGDLSIGDRVVLKSPTTTVLGSICVFNCISVCLMKLGVLRVGTNKLIIVTSLDIFFLFISIKRPSLSLLTNLGLKSTLSDISICYSSLFSETISLVNLLPTFYLKTVLVSVNVVSFL